MALLLIFPLIGRLYFILGLVLWFLIVWKTSGLHGV